MKPNLLPSFSLVEHAEAASTAADTGADPQTSANMRNWMECVRSRKTPNAPIEAGYSHSIALCMNVAAIQTGQKVTFDDKTQQVMAGRQGLCVAWLCSALLAAADDCFFADRSCAATARACRSSPTRRSAVSTSPSTASPSPPTSGPTTLKKPVLYPLIADGGITVTRGYPLDPRPGERVDHPHHAGLWFNYGNVNGFDFWNNSDAIKPEDRAKMGTILQTKIVSTKSGADRGELVVDSVWVTGAGPARSSTRPRAMSSRAGRTRASSIRSSRSRLSIAPSSTTTRKACSACASPSWLESPDEKGGVFIGRERQAHARSQAADISGRNRRVPHQRRHEGRRSLGHARALVLAHRTHRRPHCHHRHSRPPGEPRLSDLLACARLWPVRRESAGPQHLRSRSSRRSTSRSRKGRRRRFATGCSFTRTRRPRKK